jgi:hypothetical protein
VTFAPPAGAPAPGPENRRLGALVGRWRSKGHVVGEPPVPITGSDVAEWLPGGFLLVHHVEWSSGTSRSRRSRSSARTTRQRTRSPPAPYDHLGNVTIMRARVDDPGRVDLHRRRGGRTGRPALHRRRQRRGALNADVSPDRSNMPARWQRSDDSAPWQPRMHMHFTHMP